MKRITAFISLSVSITVFSQQDPELTVFWNQAGYFNPAAAGLNYKISATANARNQWPGVSGHPITYVASYDQRVEKVHGGLGATVLSDEIGFNKMQMAQLRYSYQIKFENESVLSMGIAAGIQKFKNTHFIYPMVQENPFGSGRAFTCNIGIIYNYKNFSAGLSSNNFTSPVIGLYSTHPYNYLTVDYTWNLNEQFQLIPRALIEITRHELNANINLTAYYKKQLWLGVSWFPPKGISAMAGVDIREKFRIGYSLGMITDLGSSSENLTHEIVLGFYLK